MWSVAMELKKNEEVAFCSSCFRGLICCTACLRERACTFRPHMDSLLEFLHPVRQSCLYFYYIGKCAHESNDYPHVKHPVVWNREDFFDEPEVPQFIDAYSKHGCQISKNGHL